MALTVGSLFAGIGGLDLGLERAGMEVRWQVDIDPFCRKVLEKHWPNVRRYEDVRDVGAHNLEDVDLVCGGFPCQDISLANQRGKKLAGERSGLWYEFARILRELQPRWVLIENVASLRYKRGGLPIVLQNLAQVGYDAEWHCIPARSVGAPHERDRVFITAYDQFSGVQGPITRRSPRKDGQWEWTGEEDLLAIAEAPFESGDRWPAPLLRRVDDGLSWRVERTKTLGNAVVPQIAEFVGRMIGDADERTNR